MVVRGWDHIKERQGHWYINFSPFPGEKLAHEPLFFLVAYDSSIIVEYFKGKKPKFLPYRFFASCHGNINRIISWNGHIIVAGMYYHQGSGILRDYLWGKELLVCYLGVLRWCVGISCFLFPWKPFYYMVSPRPYWSVSLRFPYEIGTIKLPITIISVYSGTQYSYKCILYDSII